MKANLFQKNPLDLEKDLIKVETVFYFKVFKDKNKPTMQTQDID